MGLETLLKNSFSCDCEQEPFVDQGSHIALTFSRSQLGIQEIAPRGLVNTRSPLTKPGLGFFLQAGESIVPLTGVEIASLPGCVIAQGSASVAGVVVEVELKVAVQTCNCYRFHFIFKINGKCELPLTLLGGGRWSDGALDSGAQRDCKAGECRFAQAVRHCDKNIERIYGLDEDWASTWCWVGKHSENCREMENAAGMAWMLSLGKVSPENMIELALQCENRPWNNRFDTYPEIDWSVPFEQVATVAKKRILNIMNALPGRERNSRNRELRAAMILDRCSYQGGRYGRWQKLRASFCMVDNWASTSFFWDSAFGALGLVEFVPEQAFQALEVLFSFQRKDGCVPTHAYEYSPGSTFLPQPPLLSWAVNHLWERTGNIDFVQSILPKLRGVFDWFTLTQDHDGDGLPEFRFSGQIADNSPLYDDYVAAVPGHGDCWNVYLPPIASPALAGFAYADAHWLAKFYRLFGDEANAAAVEKRVEAYPDLLMKICYDKATDYFQDYNHNTQRFNRCRVLTALLPIWAGMPLEAELKKRLIEKNLLSPTRFGGTMPFPYVARDDQNYTPKGYWRGRIWPHTTTWMLELLWQNGYQKEADALADNLVKNVLDREICIRENYFSGEDVGGGSEDYQWSSGVYLYLCNRRYRCRGL